jgi:N-acetylmuramoyl-L-alanine amidase
LGPGCSRDSAPERPSLPPSAEREWQGLPYRSAADLLGSQPQRLEPSEQGIWELFTSASHWQWQAGSRRMWFNGILLWLDFPAILADGVLYLPVHDIEYTILPLIAMQAGNTSAADERTTSSRLRIMIDAGHGGRDPGARNETFGLVEKELALKTALKLADTLRLLGWDVVFTREDDTFVPLQKRGLMAVEAEADLFLSIHYNAAVNHMAEGIEVFTLTPPTAEEKAEDNRLAGHAHYADSLRLGWQLQHALVRQTRSVDRGVKRNRFAVLRDLTQPGVLVELGFLSHEATARQLAEPEALNALVEALAIGLEAYADGFNRD